MIVREDMLLGALQEYGKNLGTRIYDLNNVLLHLDMEFKFFLLKYDIEIIERIYLYDVIL